MGTPDGLGRCPARGRPPDCVSTADATGDPRRRLQPLAVAPGDQDVIGAALRVLARLPRGRVLERDRSRVRARSRSRMLRIPTEVTLVRRDGVVHLRLAGPAGLLLPLRLRGRGREVLAALDAELRGWPAPEAVWLRR